MSTYSRYRRRIGDTVNNGVAWKMPSCICSCQRCIKSEVFCRNCWTLRRRLEAATCCRRGPQYDGKCSFYFNCYFFPTSPTNRDLREKAVYFPPRVSLFLWKNHTRYFSVIDEKLSVIAGDFNIDLLPQSLPTSSELFVSQFSFHDFIPTIILPTRIQNNSGTLTDHVWVNSMLPVITGVLMMDISDHYPTFICINNVFRKNTELIKSKFWCFSEVNVSNFKNRVGDIVSSFMMYNNLDSSVRCGKFSELLNVAYDLSCPIKAKTMSVKRINSPWLTPQLIKSVSSKHKLYLMPRTNADYIPCINVIEIH